MRILLDTHIVLWAASDPDRLGAAADLLVGAEERLISAASIWELSIKQGLGKVNLGMTVVAWAKRTLTALAAQPLPIRVEHAAAVADLPPIHRDPFDRILIAQAQQENMVLLTADRVLTGYGDFVRLTSQQK